MNKLSKGIITAFIFCSLLATTVYAAQQEPAIIAPSEKATPETLALAGTHKVENGVEIYKDAIGGTVIHFLDGGVGKGYLTKEEQQQQFDFISNHPEEEQKAAQIDLEIRKKNPALYPVERSPLNKASSSNYYDVENNPVWIGSWNPGDCGSNSPKTYARHTLGSKTTVGSQDYLTSYGDTSWYNSSNQKALPYRNGNATVSGQNVVDVAANASFSIRDMGTNNATTINRTDFGPNQCPGSRYTKTICDLDTATFRSLHGNTSDGIFYSRTWVPLTHYFPS